MLNFFIHAEKYIAEYGDFTESIILIIIALFAIAVALFNHNIWFKAILIAYFALP